MNPGLYNNYNLLLGEQIKRFRRKNNLTQENLAELVSRSKNHISKIEQGIANAPISLIFDIALALNVEPYELFVFDKYSKIFIKNIDVKKELSLIKNKSMLNKLYLISKILIEE